MKSKRILLITVVSLLLLGALALPAGAQSPVTVEVDRTQLTTDETLTLTLTVEAMGGQASAPSLPSLDGFQVLGSSSGTQVSIINGDMQSQATYRYTLRPLQAGQFTIPAYTIQLGDQAYTTDPIAIDVTQGTGQLQPVPNPSIPQMPALPGSMSGSAEPLDPADAPVDLAGQDFFIESVVDKNDPYQGEQVIYTFRFYQAANLFDQPVYQGPTFTGFWSEEQNDQQRNYTTEVAGRAYRVTEVPTVLFPTVVGELTIEPASLTMPGDWFSRGEVLHTQPISLNVRPLPQGAPAGFQGAVGRFAIESSSETAATKVGETLTLDVAIHGQGNLQTMADPQWSEGPEWRAFDNKAEVETQFVDGTMTGTRRYERLLVPTQPGDLILPAASLTFFDPATETYETVSSEPLIVQVTGDPAVGGQSQGVDTTTSIGTQGNTMPASTSTGQSNNLALRPNKSVASFGGGDSAPLTTQAGYWLLWVVPLALLGGSYGWQRARAHQRDHASDRRSQQAAAVARKALRRSPSNADRGEVAAQITLTYLETKLQQPVARLSSDRLSALLAEKGVDATTIDWTLNCLAAGEISRYAPSGAYAATTDSFRDAERLIEELEKSIQR
jgi:hypothetical protein